MALQRVWIPSPNYSTRSGSVRLIVLHTAEGAKTYQSLGSYFSNPASQVSSHVGIDDTAGVVGEYVKRNGKAWTQGNANSASVAAELCAWATWPATEWDRHPNMLNNTAQWIAEEAAAFGIPIVKLNAQQAQSNGRGVCQHVDLGAWGGGHHDCGPAFPMDRVLQMAGGKPGASAPSTPAAPPPPAAGVPPLHVDYFGRSHNHTVPDVRTWQQQMKNRGWNIGVDQNFGPQSETVCRQFQAEKHLAVDGLVGPQTWATSWTAPVT
jgi:hypothetical protein